MKSQKRLLASTVRLVSLGGIATLLLYAGFQYPMYLVEDAIAASHRRLHITSQDKEDTNTSTPDSGGTGSQDFGAASARVGNPPPSGGRQTSGDERNLCFTSPVLTALSPSGNFGTTLSPQPTFWFYLPEISDGFRGKIIGKFGLLDRDGNPVFNEITLTLPEQAGYVGFSVPADISLEVGEDYRWYFKFNCTDQTPTNAVFGWIRRIEIDPDQAAQIIVSDQAAYNVYVDNLIWFDVIDYFTRRRLAEPDNQKLREIWSDLLGAKGIDLETLRSDPLLFEHPLQVR